MDSMTQSPDALPTQPPTLSLEELHVKRVLCAKEREERLKKSHAKATKLVKSAERLHAQGKYAEAASVFAEASRKWNTNFSICLKYAEACIDANKYMEAEITIRQALYMNPKHAYARYMRGISRLFQGDLPGASEDFETVLRYGDSNHTDSIRGLECILFILESDLGETLRKSYIPRYNEFHDATDPKYQDVGIEYEDISDSEDSKLRGNEVTCRHYNKKDAGCKNGLKCKWLHGADCRSVRDKLGRNVCAYHLFGMCKFGAEKCFYSHDETWLPDKGWWKHPAQVERMKSIISKFEHDAKLYKEQQSEKPNGIKPKSRTKSKSSHTIPFVADIEPNMGSSNLTAGGTSGTANGATETQKSKKKKKTKKRSKGKKNQNSVDRDISALMARLSLADSDSELDCFCEPDECQINPLGFTDSDVEELMDHDVDDDALVRDVILGVAESKE